MVAIANNCSPEYKLPSGKTLAANRRVFFTNDMLSPVVTGALFDGVLSGKNTVLHKVLDYSFASIGLCPTAAVKSHTIDQYAKAHDIPIHKETHDGVRYYSNWVYPLVQRTNKLEHGKKETLEKPNKNSTIIVQSYCYLADEIPATGLPLELLTLQNVRTKRQIVEQLGRSISRLTFSLDRQQMI